MIYNPINQIFLEHNNMFKRGFLEYSEIRFRRRGQIRVFFGGGDLISLLLRIITQL